MWLRSLMTLALVWFVGSILRRMLQTVAQPQRSQGFRAPGSASERNAGTAYRDAGRRAGRAPGQADDVMVRDRVCNTFLPRSRALEASSGGDRHYFCSEACRDSFLGAPGSTGADHYSK